MDIAQCEAVVMALLDHLRPSFGATLHRLEHQQVQTVSEREEELEDELHGSAINESKLDDNTKNESTAMMKRMLQFSIQKECLWAGMASPFPTVCSSCMA